MTQTIHYVQTSVLNMAYEDRGPEDGFPVVLLHGWPDDIHTWDAVVPSLHEAGFRTITPYLRGFGPTRFRDETTVRSGQLAALGQDIVELVQGLGLERFALVGHDWGARAAYIAATECGDRVSHLIAFSVGYGTGQPDQPLSFEQAHSYWYHWYFCLPRGEAVVRESRRELCQYMWQTWSPTWQHSNDDFNKTAESFDNPDWADVTLHSYRSRWGQAETDPRYQSLEDRLAAFPQIHVPTLVLHGEADAVSLPASSLNKEPFFTNRYQRLTLPNVGHFPQREALDVVTHEILAWLQS